MGNPWDIDVAKAVPGLLAYAGVGSRKTPSLVLDRMTAIAEKLAREGWTMRSGGADGADQAFYEGVDVVEGKVELYLPWAGYNSHDPAAVRLDTPTQQAFGIAQSYHPNWVRLSVGAQKLHARNVHIVLGPDPSENVAANPSRWSAARFVVCWTPDGATKADATGTITGGTGQAIRIADSFKVEVYNLARPDHWKLFGSFLG